MAAPLAVQLYTVRDAIAQDGFAPVVKQIAAAGYVGVEMAGFSGTTPKEAAKLFADLGLRVCSGHFPMPVGEKQNEVLDQVATIGARRLVGGFWENDFKTADAIKETAAKFNEAAAVAGKHGLTIGVHNHWWEFLKVDGRYAYEILLDHLDSRVFLEVDVYWAKTAGADPAAELKKIGARAPLLHIKDGPCVQGQPMTAVGAGQVDFRAIAKVTAPTAAWWIVELDSCATDMLAAVRQSYKYLTTKGLAHGR